MVHANINDYYTADVYLKKINTTAQFTLISLCHMTHLIIYNNFYPILLEYDSGKKAGEFLKKEKQNIVISYDYNFDETDKLNMKQIPIA